MNIAAVGTISADNRRLTETSEVPRDLGPIVVSDCRTRAQVEPAPAPLLAEARSRGLTVVVGRAEPEPHAVLVSRALEVQGPRRCQLAPVPVVRRGDVRVTRESEQAPYGRERCLIAAQR